MSTHRWTQFGGQGPAVGPGLNTTYNPSPPGSWIQTTLLRTICAAELYWYGPGQPPVAGADAGAGLHMRVHTVEGYPGTPPAGWPSELTPSVIDEFCSPIYFSASVFLPADIPSGRVEGAHSWAHLADGQHNSEARRTFVNQGFGLLTYVSIGGLSALGSSVSGIWDFGLNFMVRQLWADD